MSAFTEEPRKFLPSEWLLTNQVQYGNAEAECSRSERVIAASKALVEETDRATQRMQQDVNKKLEQRIHNVRFWKEELNRELDEMTREMEELQTFRTRVEKALESCSEPLQVTQQCLAEREKHEGTELVHDEAELELRKEKEVIEGAICLLQRTLEQTDEQMRMNRSAMYSLKKDLQDKLQAEKIDDFCSVLTTTSPRLFQNKEEYRSVPGTPVTPEGWENFSSVNISKAKGQKNSSQSLRALVERVLEQTAADMRRQHQASAAALQLCIQRTKSSKEQLEDHLNQVLAEISGQEKNLVSLREAIEAKQGPVRAAETRVAARSQRPGVELCCDSAHLQLSAQLLELSAHISRLNTSLSQSEMELRSLTQIQLSLEEQIQLKSTSLYIDEVICSRLHQPIAIQNF